MNMKTRQSRRQTAKVSHSRWLAYATASAATAFAGSNSAEGAIHYSGFVGEKFAPDFIGIKSFQLDQPGDSLVFGHGFSSAYFFGRGFSAFRGTGTDYDLYVSKLSRGQSIAAGDFIFASSEHPGYMAGARPNVHWNDPGVGFVGFRLNSGAGIQYGWARVRMAGAGWANAFKLIDYAYADPGEPIRAGQRSSDEQAPDQGSTDEQGPDEGSLGWLALGAAGLLAWRRRRARMTSLE